MEEAKPDSDTSEEELNVESERFNPIKALTSEKFKLPVQVSSLDNMAMLEARLRRADGDLATDLTVNIASKKKAEPAVVVDEEKYHVTRLGRIFLKEQAPVPGKKLKKFSKNIFTRMEEINGPLALLKNYKDNKIRIKVFTRKEKGIRGFVTGYLEAFDKHFNLALVDCHEQWKRKKYYFSDNPATLGQSRDCSKDLERMGIKLPELNVKSLNRKYVELSRKVPQLMLRGEHVILVTTDVPTKFEEGAGSSRS